MLFFVCQEATDWPRFYRFAPNWELSNCLWLSHLPHWAPLSRTWDILWSRSLSSTHKIENPWLVLLTSLKLAEGEFPDWMSSAPPTLLSHLRWVEQGLLVKSAPFFVKSAPFFSCPKVVKSAPFFVKSAPFFVKSAPFFSVMLKGYFVVKFP